MRQVYRCRDCGRGQRTRDSGCWCTGTYRKRTTGCLVAGPEDVPVGEHGDCRIEKTTFTERTNVGSHHGPRMVPAGTEITRLLHGRSLWMSNTPDEVRSQRFHIEGMPHPTILIGGLGLGAAISYVDEHCIPERVVVVEIDPDVIALVEPTYAHIDWLEIVEGDIRTYGKEGPRATFDVAWIDIWGDYNSDLLVDYFAVRRSLRLVMKPGQLKDSWDGSRSRVQMWNEGLLKYYRTIGR